ncbi:hypothetical protein INT43_000808, partial [Umbelopsis isabellina]
AGTFDRVADDNEAVLRQIFENNFEDLKYINGNAGISENQRVKDKQVFEKAKNYYGSCLDEQTINQLGTSPLKPLLENLASIWHTHSGEKISTITNALSYLISIGVSPFFSIYADADSKNPGVNTLYLQQQGLGLPTKEYYSVPATMELYEKILEDTWKVTMSNGQGTTYDPDTDIASIARKIVDFEKKLASISNSTDELRDPVATYNPVRIDHLNELTPNIGWSQFMSERQVSSKPVEAIIVESPIYVQKLGKLIEETDLMTLRHHFTNALLFSAINSMSEEIRAPYAKLQQALEGNKQVLPRWKTCIRNLGYALGQLAGRYYVLEKFGADSQKYADIFVHNLRDSLEERFYNQNFLDDQTRATALEKLHKIQQKIGYSQSDPNIMSPESLDNYYQGISSTPLNYFENHLSYRVWENRQTWSLYGMPVNKLRWAMNPQDVNAYYSPLINEIVFPAGILQPPFYDANYPDYLNFGGIGAVMGHEMTHGFDDTGRLYNAVGKIESWWTKETEVKFDDKAQCFIQQYSNFTISGADNKPVHVNGKLTVGENLADNGGILISYYAWKARSIASKISEINGPNSNSLLMGLDHYTPEQLFFINFGRVWCQKIRPEKSLKRIYTDPHSPNRWRVNGVAQNSVEFAMAFGCPAQAPMNPDKKCHLW